MKLKRSKSFVSNEDAPLDVVEMSCYLIIFELLILDGAFELLGLLLLVLLTLLIFLYFNRY